MTAEQILYWWLVWLALGAVIVVAAAALLLTIIGLAHSIGKLAGTALGVVQSIEENTRPVWQLNTTNRVAGELAAGAEGIARNTEAIATALTGAPPERHGPSMSGQSSGGES